MRHRPVVLSAALLLSVVGAAGACGGSGGAQPGAAGDAGVNDPEAGPEAGPEAADAGPILGKGEVSVVRYFGSKPAEVLGGLAASFRWVAEPLDVGPPLGATGGCTTHNISTCEITSCMWTYPARPGDPDYDAGGADASPPSVDAGGPPVILPTAHAGTITVTTGAPTPPTLEPMPGTKKYEFVEVPALWAAGATVRVQGAGAVVPAFDLNVPAPSMITMIEPAAPASGDPKASRASDLILRWQPSNGEPASGSLRADMTAIEGKFAPAGHPREEKRTDVKCVFDVSARTAAIPAAVMQTFPQAVVTLTVETFSESRQRVGDWEITARGEGEAEQGSRDYRLFIHLE